jgi:hypothetical protein
VQGTSRPARRLTMHARRAPAIAALVLVAACAGTPGWSPAAPPAPSVDVCTRFDATPGRAPREVFVAVTAANPRSDVPLYYLRAVAYETGFRIHLTDDSLRQSGAIALHVRYDGEVSDLRIDSAGPSAAFDDSVVSAVHEAANFRALEFQKADRVREDSLSLFVRASVRPGTIGADEPEAQAILVPGNPEPFFPADASHHGRTDEILVEFIVNQAGRADPDGTFRVLSAKYSDFYTVVINTLVHMRFVPAQVHGCAVKQLVQLPFRFTFAR